MAAAVFEVENVRYCYDRVVALDGATLTVTPGLRLALLGANGSGKSTLLRLLDGLYFAESGAVQFEGEALTEARFDDEAFGFDFRRRVGMLFQNPDVQLFNPSVLDEVAFGPLQLRWPAKEIRNRVEAMLERLHIAHLKERVPHRLSGGEKKRVAIASVLILDPQVLLLDEPTAALDPQSQSQMIEIIAGWQDSGRTVVTATHDLDILEEIADRCCVFQAGRVVADGTPAEILENEGLLRRTGLLHAHLHTHSSGEVHSHPHRHHDHRH
ncbi:MAG TPA: ABC transporter ATP-binding protein [Bryobacteraceae bacterium]|nr:ABC transporter ATP-binding protein [Bryobacteraceae bacterium]